MLLLAVATVAALAACTGTGSASPSPVPSTPSPTADPLAGLTLAQRVGQLFMVGTPAAAAAPGTLDDIGRLDVGGVFLSGRSTASVAATRDVVARLTAADPGGAPLLVATDQEGGEVQVLQGAGFERMPSALAQAGTPAADLQQAATRWGRELHAAGVNMDLAPVADVVDSPQQAATNPPVGQLQREYGYGAAAVGPHAQAFSSGMLAADVVPVAKHFPGLGAVSGNTDFTASVTDPVTSASSPSVGVFRGLIEGGMPAVMVSTAIYARIDPAAPAAFSAPVVTRLLRGALGFRGVVLTDDVSAARQVAAWSPADRAIDAIDAGVDIVLVSAAPGLAPQMIAAVVAKAQTDAAFAARVDAACARVLVLKQRYLRP